MLPAVVMRSFMAAATVVIMSDSRGELEHGYHKLAIDINRRHAQQHGAEFVFVHTPCLERAATSKTCAACVHPVYGPRASSWCKLVAINQTMKKYSNHSRFVYMDSDAVFRKPLMDDHWSKHVSMFTNYPWHDVVPFCAGVQLWTRGARSQRILDAWWNSPCLDHAFAHDYEQFAWHPGSKLYQRYGQFVHVIDERTLVDAPGQTITHIASNRASERVRRFNAIKSGQSASAQRCSQWHTMVVANVFFFC